MAGEMYESDVTLEEYPLHFAIADALGGQVRPFDQYQGPYVVIGPDVRIGSDPYAYCSPGSAVRLWITYNAYAGEGGAQVYNEANGKLSALFFLSFDERGYGKYREFYAEAVERAREVL